MQRIACVASLLALLAGVCLFLAYDESQRNLPDCPKVEAGVIDFAGYDTWARAEIPLDGQWEFYWKKWLVTDQLEAAGEPSLVPDCLIDLPSSWAGLNLGGETLRQDGWASYRLHVRNCPVDQLTVYIPDFNSSYRVFIDGYCVLFHGELAKDPAGVTMRTTVLYSEANPSTARDFDIVIEAASSFTGGLYKTPVLQTTRDAIVHSGVVTDVQAACLGIIAMSLILLLLIRVFKDGEFDTSPLSVLSLLLLILVFAHSQIAHMRVFDILSKHYTPLWVLTMAAFAVMPAILYLACSRLTRQTASKTLLCVLSIGALAVGVGIVAFAGSPTPGRTFALTCVAVAAMLVAVVAIMRDCWLNGSWESFVLGLSSAVLAVSVLLNAWYWRGMVFLNISLLLGLACVAYLLVILCIYIRRKAIAQRRELELREIQVRLRDAEVQLMLSQIQPHFVYNTLTSVLALIDIEPQRASDLLLKFTQYLRTNIDSLKGAELIGFEQELNHIRTYLEIEQVRLGSRLAVSIDCPVVDFLVPQLCIQPFVENAVKHGIAQKEDGGTVSVSSSEEDAAFVVRVADTGVGFDVQKLLSEEQGSIGISNVIYRFEQMMGARVDIESAEGQGTEVAIRIPKTPGLRASGDQAVALAKGE